MADLDQGADDVTHHVFQKAIGIDVDEEMVALTGEGESLEMADRLLVVGQGALERGEVLFAYQEGVVDHGKILTLDSPAALKRSLPGAQVLDLWVRAPRPLAPRLREVPGVRNLEAVDAGGLDGAGGDGVERVRLFVDPADGLLYRVLRVVREGGADLHHVNLAQPSLEVVYIHLTGRGLRE